MNHNIKTLGYIFLFVVLLGLAARVSIDLPLTDINITAQTLVLLFLASIFKPKVAVYGILLYLILGILGVPLFSEGAAGWEYFEGGSLGYFIGFVLATILVSYMTSYPELKSSLTKLFALHLVATLIILFSGTLRLRVDMGLTEALGAGFKPFVVGGIIKSFASSLLAYLVLKRFKRVN